MLLPVIGRAVFRAQKGLVGKPFVRRFHGRPSPLRQHPSENNERAMALAILLVVFMAVLGIMLEAAYAFRPARTDIAIHI